MPDIVIKSIVVGPSNTSIEKFLKIGNSSAGFDPNSLSTMGISRRDLNFGNGISLELWHTPVISNNTSSHFSSSTYSGISTKGASILILILDPEISAENHKNIFNSIHTTADNSIKCVLVELNDPELNDKKIDKVTLLNKCNNPKIGPIKLDAKLILNDEESINKLKEELKAVCSDVCKEKIKDESNHTKRSLKNQYQLFSQKSPQEENNFNYPDDGPDLF